MILKTFSLLVVSALFLTVSGLQVNKNLETSISCNSTEDCLNYLEFLGVAECNSDSVCQCPFQFYPTPSKGEGSFLDQCSSKLCALSSSCVELYLDENSTCNSAGICDCRERFKFNDTSKQCEYEEPEVVALGQNCSTSGSNQCGWGASCVTGGYCKCSIGHVPETAVTCRRLACDSDAFCNAQVTPNSRCESPGSELSQCLCKDDFRPDFFGQQCIPRNRKVGETCNHMIYPFFCGSQSWCVSGVCKCPMNMAPEPKYKMDCEELTCSKDRDCHVGDENAVCRDRKCECRPTYEFDKATVSCVQSKSFTFGLIIYCLIYSFGLVLLAMVIRARRKAREAATAVSMSAIDDKPPPYAENPPIMTEKLPKYA